MVVRTLAEMVPVIVMDTRVSNPAVDAEVASDFAPHASHSHPFTVTSLLAICVPPMLTTRCQNAKSSFYSASPYRSVRVRCVGRASETRTLTA